MGGRKGPCEITFIREKILIEPDSQKRCYPKRDCAEQEGKYADEYGQCRYQDIGRGLEVYLVQIEQAAKKAGSQEHNVQYGKNAAAIFEIIFDELS